MLPPALASLLHGPGTGGPPPGLPVGGPPPGAGGPPPNPLMALLGGGPGAPAPKAPPAGGGSEDQPIAILKQMLALGQKYMSVEPDEEDKATMSQVVSKLQAYLAKDQKENDQMLSGVMQPRAMRKLGGPQAG